MKLLILLRIQKPYCQCSQDYFPLEFLSCFPSALIEFQKPPVEGGLCAGAMLCIQRALGVDQDRGGYAVMNRFRCEKNKDIEINFTPA